MQPCCRVTSMSYPSIPNPYFVASISFFFIFTEALTPPSLAMVLCKYNLQARCTKGDLCQYEHNRSTVPSLSKRTAGQGIGTAGKPKVCLPDASPVPPCRFFQSGRCLKGSGCTFAHIIPSHSPAEGLKPQPVIPSPQDSRSQVLCKFYVHGECTNGNSCPYSHSDAAVIVSSQEERDKYKVGRCCYPSAMSTALRNFRMRQIMITSPASSPELSLSSVMAA